jgi:hypothetical protein
MLLTKMVQRWLQCFVFFKPLATKCPSKKSDVNYERIFIN